jgi:truncated hemoglobin YjbI
LEEWLGGAAVLEGLMVKFYQRVSTDELFRPLFGEVFGCRETFVT